MQPSKLKNLIYMQAIILSVLIALINGCTSKAPQSVTSKPVISVPVIPEDVLSDKTIESKIIFYKNLAKTSTVPADRQYYLLLAAELSIDSKQNDEAMMLLTHINRSQLDQSYHKRVFILEANLALLDKKYPIALQKLPKQILDLPPKIQANVLTIRAKALYELGYPLDSINTRIQLGPLLSDIESIDKNNTTIWSVLNTLSSSTLNRLNQTQRSAGMRGWIELVLGLRTTSAASGNTRDAFLRTWYRRFPAHPAADDFINKLRSGTFLSPEHPASIALLLPLSSKNSKLSQAAEAIRDGFMMAYYDNEFANKPKVQVFDVGNDPESIWSYHQQAQVEGANFIVGPLHKKAVNNLASAINLEVPVLALNYVSESPSFSEKMFQFGLLPEDEAKQAAELAIIKGQTKAAVLAPNTSLGKRLQTAFSQHFKNLGGQVLSTEFYSYATNNHSGPIVRTLNIQQSKTRHSILRSVIKQKIKFEARRRQDIDVIFLVANPKQARLIKPLLKFHEAGDIDVYATSHAYAGQNNPNLDKEDLEGLFFLNSPWSLKTAGDEQFEILSNNWPAKMSVNSPYYALGIDAFRIIPFLQKLQIDPFERFAGYTGNISLDTNNRIHRELTWAQFTNGIPKVMDFTSLSSAEDEQEAEIDGQSE